MPSFSYYFPVALVLGWVGVSWLISWTGGWGRLARHYRHTTQVEKTWHHVRIAYFGWAGYGNCLTAAATADGLFLAPYLPWRPGHPPLFVPWEDVTVRAVSGILWGYLEFRFVKEPLVTVALPTGLGRRLLADAGRQGKLGILDVE
jgi:hypothetical protein